jgi:hypothetical protein
VIDTESRQVVRTLDVPGGLAGGGFLVTYQPGRPLVDTFGR